MSKPVISVEHLTKRYDLGVIGTGTISRDLNRWWARLRKKPDPYTRIGQADGFARAGESILALDDVSFQVMQGEALGIIGRNGAGKSTLLKILSRVTAPTSGLVRVRGRIGSLLEVGTGFHPELTGRENVYLNGAILGMKKAEVTRKFDEIVSFAGVQKFIDTPVKRYSSGMYVRLAFAVAAHLDPEILIVDEVLAVGDAEFQKKCLGKMGDAAGEGRTVLFVSHNMAAIKFLCEKGLFLDSGKLVNIGLIENIVSDYITKPNQESIVLLDSRPIITPIISEVCLRTEDGHITTSFSMGQKFSIEASYKSNYQIKKPGLGIRVNSHQGVTVFGCTEEMYPVKIIKNSDEGKSGIFRLFFNNPCLNQGDYSLTLTFSENGKTIKKYPDVIRFSITPVDIYNTGVIAKQDQSLIFTDATWELEIL